MKPHYKSTKQTVTLHLPLDVVEKFKSTGKNWQAKMNEVLRQYSVNL
ncbi:BrnA antitoxin family protein [Actinobacillus porcinus]